MTGQVINRVADALGQSRPVFESETGGQCPVGAISGHRLGTTMKKVAPNPWFLPPIICNFGTTQPKMARKTGGQDGEILEPEGAPAFELAMEEPAWAQDGPADEAAMLIAEQVEAQVLADPAWVEMAEAEVMASLSGQPAEDDLDPVDAAEDLPDEAVFAAQGAENPAGAEMIYDEEILRGLVRDLIREELQGSLGERITRNVRKLVRMEVARALALHDFE